MCTVGISLTVLVILTERICHFFKCHWKMTLKWNNKYFETLTFLHQDAHFTPGNEWLLHALSHSRFFLSLPTSCFHFLKILKDSMLLWKLYPALTRSWPFVLAVIFAFYKAFRSVPELIQSYAQRFLWSL